MTRPKRVKIPSARLSIFSYLRKDRTILVYQDHRDLHADIVALIVKPDHSWDIVDSKILSYLRTVGEFTNGVHKVLLEARLLNYRGVVSARRGRYQEALDALDRSMDLTRDVPRLDYIYLEAHSLVYGPLYLLNREAEAEPILQKGLKHARTVGDEFQEISFYLQLGALEANRFNFEKAYWYSLRSYSISRAIETVAPRAELSLASICVNLGFKQMGWRWVASHAEGTTRYDDGLGMPFERRARINITIAGVLGALGRTEEAIPFLHDIALGLPDAREERDRQIFTEDLFLAAIELGLEDDPVISSQAGVLDLETFLSREDNTIPYCKFLHRKSRSVEAIEILTKILDHQGPEHLLFSTWVTLFLIYSDIGKLDQVALQIDILRTFDLQNVYFYTLEADLALLASLLQNGGYIQEALLCEEIITQKLETRYDSAVFRNESGKLLMLNQEYQSDLTVHRTMENDSRPTTDSASQNGATPEATTDPDYMHYIGQAVHSLQSLAESGAQAYSSDDANLLINSAMGLVRYAERASDSGDVSFDLLEAEVSQRLFRRYPSLSPSELRVATLAFEGRTLVESADIMGTGTRSIQKHRQTLRKKLNVPRSIELTEFLRQGLDRLF